ncbi:MAG: hypothetical protein Hens3KO_07910 [Henriciella sp.]
MVETLQRRPLIQTNAATAGIFVIFVLCAIMAPDSGRFVGPMLFVSFTLAGVLLILTWIDLDRFLLPNWLTIPLLLLGLVYSYYLGGGFWLALLGAALGYGLILGISTYWRRQFGKDGIGLGDAKLLGAGGAWLGVFAIPLILLVSSGAALLAIGLAKLAGHRLDRHAFFPFGPMLALGIWSIWCFPWLVPA